MKFKRNNSYYETWGTTDGERRDKRRCANYNKGFCTLFQRKCFSSSHCSEYFGCLPDYDEWLDDCEESDPVKELKNLKRLYKKGVKVRTLDVINGIKRLNAVICELFNYKTNTTMKCYISSEDIDELYEMRRLEENVPIALRVKKINVGEEFVINKIYKYKLIAKSEKEFIRKKGGC